MNRCTWTRPWVGKCDAAVEDGKEFCPEHRRKCISCGKKATRGCSATMGLVCGYPLCPNCTHVTYGNGHIPTEKNKRHSKAYRQAQKEFERKKEAAKEKAHESIRSARVRLTEEELFFYEADVYDERKWCSDKAKERISDE